MENNGREIKDRRLPWGPNGTRRATGASNGVEYGVSDEELCGARVEVLRVVHRSPSGGACTRQVHADNTRGASGGRARAHLLLGSACGPTAVWRALHGHVHTTLPACGRTRLGPATRARFPEAAADAETAIAGCGSRCGQPNLVTTFPRTALSWRRQKCHELFWKVLEGSRAPAHPKWRGIGCRRVAR